MNVVLRTAEAATAHGSELPFSPIVFGIAAFGVLIALLLVAFAFRSVGTRH